MKASTGAGSIANCGIQQIEDLARSDFLRVTVIATDIAIRKIQPDLLKYPELNSLELMLRSTCRDRFASIMEPERTKHSLSQQVISDLEKVLFTLVYPTPL